MARQVDVLPTPTLATTVSLGPYFAFVFIDFFSLLYSHFFSQKGWTWPMGLEIISPTYPSYSIRNLGTVIN